MASVTKKAARGDEEYLLDFLDAWVSKQRDALGAPTPRRVALLRRVVRTIGDLESREFIDDKDACIRGWKSIADALGVSEKTARKYATTGAFTKHHDPLPVFVDHIGPCVDRAAVEDWKARGILSWAQHAARDQGPEPPVKFPRRAR
jgi:hypothetical protein